jgi:hypothetical protein
LRSLRSSAKVFKRRSRDSPEFQRRMNGAQEYAKATGGAFDDLEDDIPF